MEHARMAATGAKIDEVHREAGLEEENPPNRLAHADLAGHWAEVWATGLDSETWIYRVSDLDRQPVLVGHMLNNAAPGPTWKVDTEDPLFDTLLRAAPSRNAAFRRYVEAWLRERTTGG